MKKILLILVLMFLAISCSSSKANVPDDDMDSDNLAVTEGDSEQIDNEKADETQDEITDEITDESVDEIADIDTGLCSSDQCEIDDTCYDDESKNPAHLCNVCDVEKNRLEWSPIESGTICRIASGDCDIAEKCDGIAGDCPEDAFKPLDEPCGSTADTDCDDPDSCDGYGVCKENFIAESTTCTDDNNACNGAESCDSSGSCISEGPEVVCGDNEVCNPIGAVCECDEANGYFLSPDETFCAFAGTKVPPTGQTKCYNATAEIPCPTFASGLPFLGQDAQYTDNPSTLTIVGDSPNRVVTDSLTGLTWELDYDSTQKDWSSAKTLCTSKGADWRLPTLKELMTTTNFDHSVPVCDITYCPNNAGHFWSITEDPTDSTKALDLYMYTADIRKFDKTADTLYVRCVKGTVFNPSGVLTSNEDSTEPVVTDSLTGLSWTKTIGSKTWEEALDSCEKLNYGGHTDWRLPNVNELQTAVDYSASTSGVALPNTSSSAHWTSTTYIEVTNSAVYYSFSSGGTSRGEKANAMNHLCVR